MVDRTHLYRHLVESWGWSIILLGYRSKIPTKGESPKLRAIEKRSLQSVIDWRGNLGVMGGEISQVVIVDLDSDRSVQWAREALPETPLIQTTNKGQHWFYRLPNGLEVRPKVKVPIEGHEGLEIDLRGEESYVVGPWCLHPDGGLYEPVGDWLTVDLADVPELPEVLHPAPEVRQERIVRFTPPPMPSEMDQLERRLRNCLDKCSPSIEGQGGQNVLFSTICWVLDIGWGDVNLISRCVADWDAANSSPPWGAAYVRDMVERCVARFWSGYCDPLRPSEFKQRPTYYAPTKLTIERFMDEYEHDPKRGSTRGRVDGIPSATAATGDRGNEPPDPGPQKNVYSPVPLDTLSRLLREIPGSHSHRMVRAALPVHSDHSRPIPTEIPRV